MLASKVSVLLKIISQNQTNFVKGTTIFDNILLIQELVQDINPKI